MFGLRLTIHNYILFCGAQDGARTRTPEREKDFKSFVSTIPPPGQGVEFRD